MTRAIASGGERVEYRVLGPIGARRGDEWVKLSRRPRMLLALLLLHANEVVSTDRIIDELWGDETTSDPQNALWVVVSRLRTALDPDREKRTEGTILLTQVPGYRLVVEDDAIDGNRFVALARQGRELLQTDPAQSAEVLAEALGLWSGRAYEPFTYDDFARGEIATLETMRLEAVEDRFDAELAIGHSRDLVASLEGLVREHPNRQRLAGQLMRALHLSGRQAEALRVFSETKNRLIEEQGLEPSPELVQLEEQILLDDVAPLPGSRVGAQSDSSALSIRGYELRELVRASPVGDVYRAYQPAVGREVDIEVIGAEFANDAEFIRRFEAEAQIISQIENPQIVPIFDFWREPDSAFLVTRHFEHGTLQASVDTSPLTVDEAVGILAQISGAIVSAHRRNIAHGNVTADAVMIDSDRNAYLSSFGPSSQLALGAEDHAALRADQRQFVELSELVLRNTIDANGEPFTIDSNLSALLDQDTTTTDSTKFTIFVDRLLAAIDEHAAQAATRDIVNPYQGLRAFGEDDASNFHGRERLVERLVTRLGHAGPQGRFVAVVGPSGSGKSSVVRAGVIPALREGAAPGSDQWFVATMIPGPNAFQSLADALLRIAVKPPDSLAERLQADGISLCVERISPDPSSQVLIVVDQFEELFTQSVDAEQFIDALATVIADKHSGVKIIATLRADFYDRPLQHASLSDAVRLGTEVITPMNPKELERAVTRPALAEGVAFEPGVVAQINADMAGQPAALPLLQHALTELFDARQHGVIAASSYDNLGGVAGALAKRADTILSELSEPAQRSAQDVFVRLVTVQAGSADTRRRTLRRELIDVAGPRTEEVLALFGKHRLLTFDQDPITRAPTVEIAHEALITRWSTLQRWVDDARTAVQAQRRLAESASEWASAGEDPDLVLTGPRLANHAGWLASSPVPLTSLERRYLESSEAAAEQALEVERKRVSRLRQLVAVAGGGFVIAAIAAIIALSQQREATEAAEVAEAQTVLAEESARTADVERMRAQAVAEVDVNPPLAALLAVEAYGIDESHVSAGALQRVLTSVDGRRAVLTDGNAEYGGTSVFVEEANIVASSGRLALDVWDVDDQELILRLEEEFIEFDISDDGSLLAYQAVALAEMQLVDVASGDVLGAVPTRGCGLISMSPDGSHVAVAREESEDLQCRSLPRWVEIWDISDPRNPQLEHQTSGADLRQVFWSPSGDEYLTMSGDGLVQYWDGATHEEVWANDLAIPGVPVPSEMTGTLFRSDGGSVVVGVLPGAGVTAGGIALFSFDTATGELLGEPLSTAGLGSMNWFDEEETQMVGTFWPSGAAVFDLEAGEVVRPAPIDNPNAAAVFIDHGRGRRLVSGFVGIEISSLDGTSVLERRVGLTPFQAEIKEEVLGQLFASISGDGTRALVSVFDGSARSPIVEWDLTTDPPTIVAESGPGFALNSGDSTVTFLFSPEGVLVTVLDEEFEPLAPPLLAEQAERGPVGVWAASSDGSTQAAWRFGASIFDIYDTESGERIHEFSIPGSEDGAMGSALGFMSLSGDGAYFVGSWGTADGSNVWGIFDTDTGELVHSGDGTRFDRPDAAGTTLYARSPDNFVLERFDIETLEEVGPPLVGHTLLLEAIRDQPGSDVIVTQASNGNVRIWDRETGDQIGREIVIGRQSAGTEIAASQNGELVGIVLDEEFALWNYDLDSWPGLACDLAGRNMTQNEWDDFGPLGEEYRATCPQFPPGN